MRRSQDWNAGDVGLDDDPPERFWPGRRNHQHVDALEQLLGLDEAQIFHPGVALRLQ